MATVGVRQGKTLADFEALPVGPPYYEFEEGEIIPVPSPRAKHQKLMGRLFAVTDQFVEQNRLGTVVPEVDVYLPDGRVYIPDLVFVAAGREDLFDPIDDKIHGAPDLVVEVLSSDVARDRVHKLKVYHANGVQWYWLMDAESLIIEEYQHTPEGYLLVSSVDIGEEFHPKVFSGLVINLAALLGVTPPPAASA
jgi:Uma2 family endonuclease